MENRPPKKEKRRPGRKPGSKARHGGYSLMTRGVLPERRHYVGLYLTEVREGMIHDLAAKEEDLSTAQRVLIDRVITFLGVARLIEEHAREQGILDSRGRLSQGLTGHYLSFNRFIKETMALLGVEKRRADDVFDLADYIKIKDAAEDSETKARQASRKVRQGQAEADKSGMGNQAGLTIVPLRGSGEDISGQPESVIDCPAVGGQDQDPESVGIVQPRGLHNEGGEENDDDRETNLD